MIVSHKHRFIFIKTRKTAGTSIQEALAQICGPDDIITQTGISDEGYAPRNFRGLVNPWPYLSHRPRRHRIGRILKRTMFGERYFDHMYLYEVLALPEARAWQDYYKFCFERNPWDKMVSHYFWRYRNRESKPSFETFVRTCRDLTDYEYYTTQGKIAVDFIGRYETIGESLATIAEGIGHPVPVPGQRNSGTGRVHDFRAMYTDELRHRVAASFAREIELLGYDFD